MVNDWHIGTGLAVMEWHWIVILVIDLQRLICNGCNGLVMDWDWIGGLPRYDYVCPDVLTWDWRWIGIVL